MNVLLLTTNSSVPADYLRKLEAWGIGAAVDTLPLVQGKRETEGDFMNRITRWVRDKFGDSVDFVQVFFSRREWPEDGNVKGKQYHAYFNGYQLAIVRDYGKRVAETAEHELMHSLDNFCRTYTGASLAQVMGVEDWDRDVVHARDQKTGRYFTDFSQAFWTVQPYVAAAFKERQKLTRITGIGTALAKIAAELRKLSAPAGEPERLTDEPEARETPVEPPPAPVSPPDPPKPQPPVKTASEKLYEAAVKCLGKDMSDRAPDSLGCADSVNNIHELAFGFEIGGTTSTYHLDKALRASTRFEKVSTPRMGDIVMSPTGYSSKGAKNGHVGIVGKNLAPDGTLYVMSNDSFKGEWEANFTIAKWRSYFGEKLGFPVYFYRLR